MYPIKMNPIFKDNLWGGTKLRDEYSKDTPYDITGESWELASHKNGESRAVGGEFDGKTIDQIALELKEKLLGDVQYDKYIQNNKKFPLLIKFIDAKQSLSIQVHPDDKYAFLNENGELGKTEMWYIIEAAEGAGILYGFKEEISKEEFESAILNNTLLEYTNFVPCKKGDSFFIPAGTLHAIGEGLLIAEIQQNSDTTYRVYDYDRKDANGNLRELHIKKAVDVTERKPPFDNSVFSSEGNVIAKCEYFTVEKLVIDGHTEWKVDKRRFEAIVVLEGEVLINGNPFKKGETALIPAYIVDININGNATILKTYID